MKIAALFRARTILDAQFRDLAGAVAARRRRQFSRHLARAQDADRSGFTGSPTCLMFLISLALLWQGLRGQGSRSWPMKRRIRSRRVETRRNTQRISPIKRNSPAHARCAIRTADFSLGFAIGTIRSRRQIVMIDPLKPVTTAPALCKICGGAAPLYGVVDFNKSCQEAVRPKAVARRACRSITDSCANCAFVFTDAFDDWSARPVQDAHL